PVRLALVELIEEGYADEFSAGLGLTVKGEDHLRDLEPLSDAEALCLVSSASSELSRLRDQVRLVLERVRPALAHFDEIGLELGEKHDGVPPFYAATGINALSEMVTELAAMLERTDDRR